MKNKNFKNNLLNIFFLTMMVTFVSTILLVSLRGLPGNPTAVQLNTSDWKEEGPFELSPERGRFALTYSIAKDRSLQFSNQLGKFASPDVAVLNNKFVSLFAPGVSFLVIPGFIIGEYFNLSQVGTFGVISIFAILNFLLIRNISINLGAKKIAATFAGLIFLFATPAFAYAVNLYQHHISTFLILLGIFALQKLKTIWAILVVFLLTALAIPIDYPNLFFLLPIAVFAFFKTFEKEEFKSKLKLKINLARFFTPAVMVLPIGLFLLFNLLSYGNPFQLSGTLDSAKDEHIQSQLTKNDFDPSNLIIQKVSDTSSTTAVSFFQTRQILTGFYTHFFSPDRGIIFFSPIILLGLIGAIYAYKKSVPYTPLFIGITASNVLLYSMWGDPWGGWAFGSRYLIPSYAILSIFIAILFSREKYNGLYFIATVPLFIYSVGVNTLGAITTSANPPQSEVEYLEKQTGILQKYTYMRNWDFLQEGGSKSFIYQSFAKNNFTAFEYYLFIVSLISIGTLVTLFTQSLVERKQNYVQN